MDNRPLSDIGLVEHFPICRLWFNHGLQREGGRYLGAKWEGERKRETGLGIGADRREF